MGLCATPIWARKQLRTRVIEGRLECRGCDGKRGMVISVPIARCAECGFACARPACRAGRAHDGRCPMGRGNHTMFP